MDMKLLERFKIKDNPIGFGAKFPRIIRWGTLILFIIIIILAIIL